ncbi:MAG: hypothetical protein KME32_06170 [Mojavia pulchra JT2-VF2]|jgi:hypothetical protein|uniref:Uncharacterized protein n=1 Tax=Mojavia pulchra JT2-VF2 TaxID=287848 RepID=A0A951PVR4_9NOST|nr:hypothetical protein [Mojavia pulchra JT2-VF2]
MPIELKQFRENLIYATKAKTAIVMADLQELAALDNFAELQQNKFNKLALYYFLAVVAVIILFVIVSTFQVDAGGLALVKIVLFLTGNGLAIACIYNLVKSSKFSNLNISNYRYELTNRVLQMLSRDMEEDKEIELKLSFKPIVIPENKIETIAHPYKENWKIDKHQHEWLQLKGQFLDKTRFALSATELSKTQYGWKRSRSGKSKYKSKTNSVGLDVVLTLNYPQRRYGAVKVLQNEVTDAVKLPKLSYMKGLKVTEKAIHMAVRIAPQVATNQEEIYQTITMMFLSLYQVLNLAKILAK